MSRQLKSLAFAAALSVLAGAAVHAQPTALQGVSAPAFGDRQTQTETVSYADLDLSRQAGLRTLMARIKGAARNVCGPEPLYGEWKAPYQACVRSAVDRALAEVGRAGESGRIALNVQRGPGG